MPNRVVFEFLAKDKFTAISKKIANNNAKMRQSFGKLKKSVKKASVSLKKYSGQLKAMSLAAGVAVAGSLKAFGDMEQGLTNVFTLLSGDELEQFGGKLTKLAKGSLTEFGFTTKEATGALFDVVSALGMSESTLESFDAAQKLAVGGNADLAVSTLGIARIMTAYSEEQLNATEVANGFFAAQKAGITNVEKMARNIGKVGKIASLSGISFKELLATTSILTKSFSTEESVTGFKGLINSLTAATGDSAKMLQKFNIPVTVAELKTVGWIETLKRLNIMNEENVNNLKIAIPALEGYRSAAALMGKSIGEVTDNIASMNQDQLDTAFLMQMETFNKAAAILKGNIVVLAVTIGEQLAPGFKFMADQIKVAIDWFIGLSDNTKKWIGYGLLVVAVVSTIAIGLVVMATVVGAAAVAIAIIFGFIFSIPGLIAAMIIATLASITIAVVKSWDQIKGIGSKIADFFGFGKDSDELAVTGAADINASSKATVDVNFNDPKNTIKNVQTKTSGNTPQLDVGVALVGQS